MNFHNITKDDMLNGSGLRVVLWVSGCTHRCEGCQNPQTWDCRGGIEFDINAKIEIYEELEKDYMSGITFSGGDPFSKYNIDEVTRFIQEIKQKYPNKNIWVYTGYTYEYLLENNLHSLINIDVLVDGKFYEQLKDNKYPWAGSVNQRVIDVKSSLESGKITMFKY